MGLWVIVRLWPVPDYFDDDPTYLLNYFGRMRGTFWVFFAVVPILFSGFGNVMLSMGRGGTMRSSRLQGLGLILFYLSAVIVLSSLVFRVEWIRMVAFLFNLASGLFCSVSFVATIVARWRTGETEFRFPVMVGTLFATAVLVLVDFLLLGVAGFMVLVDEWTGWEMSRFLRGSGEWTGSGFRHHVFWFTGHPEVFVILLFAVGAMGEAVRWVGTRFFWSRGAASG